MPCIGVALIIFGVLLVLGAAGSSDAGLIPFDQTIIQVLIGLTMIGAGVLIVRIIAEIERTHKRKEIKKHERHHH